MQIIDLHTDIVLSERSLDKKLFNLNTQDQISLVKAKKANVKLILAGFSYDDMGNHTQIMLEESEKMVKNNKSNIKIILHLEGANILHTNPSLLNQYYQRGVRSLGFVHGHDNSLAGSNSSGSNKGLTKLGRQTVKEALGLGMLIDLAHASSKTIRETYKLTKKPILISHTACRALVDLPRNTTDEEIKLVAKTGGVIGIFFSKKYISSKKNVTIDDAVKHFLHIIELVGIEHVAIGSDFGGITSGTPKGLESVEKLPNLLNKLKEAGLSQSDLQKIAYKNASRVLSAWGFKV